MCGQHAQVWMLGGGCATQHVAGPESHSQPLQPLKAMAQQKPRSCAAVEGCGGLLAVIDHHGWLNMAVCISSTPAVHWLYYWHLRLPEQYSGQLSTWPKLEIGATHSHWGSSS